MDDRFTTQNHKLRAAVGFSIAALATLLSVGSYETARPGGHYVIWWGGVVWGLWYGAKHLYLHLKEQQAAGVLSKSVFQMLDGADDESRKLRLAMAFAQMALLVAAADGTVDPRELNAIREFYRRHGASEEFLTFLRSILPKLALAPEVDAAMLVLWREVEQNPELRELLALALLEVALADSHIDEREIQTIAGILVKLGLDTDEAMNLLTSFFQEEGKTDDRSSALRTLGLDEGATMEEIKVAYRDLAQKYHPDKVSHLGPELQDIAERKMKEINAAYELLTR